MKYVKLCPQCGKPQSRIDFFQPFFNFGNICKSCGAVYTSENSMVANILIGLGISILIILGAEKIINWMLIVCSGLCFLCLAIIFSPYYGKLKLLELKRDEHFLLQYMMKPFLKFQCLVLLLLVFVLSIPAVWFLQEPSFYRKNKETLNKIQCVDRGDLGRRWHTTLAMNKDLIDLLSFENVFLFILIIVLSMFFIFNIIFYLKIAYYIRQASNST